MTKSEVNDRKVILAYAPLGVIPIASGGLWVAYIYAWASMIDPALIGWARYKSILQEMIPGALPGAVLILGGLTFSMICVTYAISGSARFRPTGTKMAVILTILLLPTIVLMLALG